MTAVFSQTDLRHMRHALSLARRHRGQTAENPSVGCVLVKDNRIIGRGVTAVGGRPHAEVIALAQAGDKAAGATAYVTLEPCSHTGKTGPCADALISADIGRAVIGTVDPDSRVSGQGIEKLRGAGIQVGVGCLEAEAIQSLGDFLSHRLRSRPMVSLKIATSADGKIALSNGKSKWITGEQARRHGHRLRAIHSGILVAAGTVVADNPSLTCRIEGLEHASPIRVVLDRRLETPLSSKLFADLTVSKTILLTEEEADSSALTKLSDLGVQVIRMPSDASFRSTLQALAGVGILSILIEGGAGAAATALKAGAIDRIYHYQSPKILGADGLSAIGALGYEDLPLNEFVRESDSVALGEDILTVYARSE